MAKIEIVICTLLNLQSTTYVPFRNIAFADTVAHRPYIVAHSRGMCALCRHVYNAHTYTHISYVHKYIF